MKSSFCQASGQYLDRQKSHNLLLHLSTPQSNASLQHHFCDLQGQFTGIATSSSWGTFNFSLPLILEVVYSGKLCDQRIHLQASIILMTGYWLLVTDNFSSIKCTAFSFVESTIKCYLNLNITLDSPVNFSNRSVFSWSFLAEYFCKKLNELIWSSFRSKFLFKFIFIKKTNNSKTIFFQYLIYNSLELKFYGSTALHNGNGLGRYDYLCI